MDLVKRMEATQRTVDLYKGKPFTEGRFDCVQMVKAHARHMGRRVKIPAYKTIVEGATALRKQGFKTLAAAADHNFERIRPDQVLLGDILESPGTNGFTGLTIALGNGRALGFHEEIPHADILQPVMISGAWRIG